MVKEQQVTQHTGAHTKMHPHAQLHKIDKKRKEDTTNSHVATLVSHPSMAFMV
jgi:hypothetical protein